MFYRRKLPHWLPDLEEQSFLLVNRRLAGSVPRVQYPEPAPAPLSAGRAFLLHDRELDKAAFGPVWLQDPRVAQAVSATIENGARQRHFYQLQAWVVMPNHVHVVLRPKQPLPVITRWLKGSSARAANLILGRTGQTFWQPESFDHRIRDDAELERIVAYVENNPVTAGLVRKPGDWCWSSANLTGGSACPT